MSIGNTIVVPIDFSGESALALDAALAFGGKVHCVHVLFPLDSISPGVVLGDVSDESREESVKEKFASLVEGRDIPADSLEVLVGTPGLEIADYATRIGADLIVIPSHGYHGMKRLVLGSVAERVIRHANCSVLVLRRSDAD